MTTTDSDESELVPGAMVSFRWIDGDMYEGRIVSVTASDAVVMLESGRTTTVELSALGARDRRDRLEVRNTSERDADLNARTFHQDLASRRKAVAWKALVIVVNLVAGVVAFRYFRGPWHAKTPGLDPTAMDELPSTSVEGKKTAYRLEVPRAGGWLRLKEDSARKYNPLADLWLVAPDTGAQVLVIVERSEDGALSANALADVLVEQSRLKFSRYNEVSRKPLQHTVKNAVLVHSRSTLRGDHVEWLVGDLRRG